MGCNIHGYLETMTYPNSETQKWWSVHQLPYTRSYLFYSAIAGVRNYINITPISEPKGMPSDPSIMSEADCREDGRDGHSHSWLTAQEILNYDWRQRIETYEGKEELGTSIHPDFRSLINEMAFLSAIYGLDKVRIVFWFDN